MGNVCYLKSYDRMATALGIAKGGTEQRYNGVGSISPSLTNLTHLPPKLRRTAPARTCWEILAVLLSFDACLLVDHGIIWTTV